MDIFHEAPMKSLPTRLLPTFYYLDHFNEMLSFVERAYASILDNEHSRFIEAWKGLSQDEQCLYVRMTNRKGRIFHIDTLRYDEIKDEKAALSHLREKALLRPPNAQDYSSWLRLLKKPDLVALGRDTGLKTSWSKARMVDHILTDLPFEKAATILDARYYVVQEQAEKVEFLLYLYFGKTLIDLKSFTLRDLGVVRVNDNADFSARFDDLAEAKGYFFYHQMLRRLDEGTDYQAEMEALLVGPDIAHELRAKAAYILGSYFEKNGAPERAIQLYRFAPSPDSNERLVRILYNNGARLEARELLERIIDDPASDDEFTFANDFYARKFEGKRISATTSLLRSSQEIFIDDVYRSSPEAGTIEWFERQGWRAYHSENMLWHEIFGLLFWPQLFEGKALASGFDRLPKALKAKTFINTPGVSETLEAVRSNRGLPRMLKNFAAYHGKVNGLFSWDWLDMDAITNLFSHASNTAIADILELMVRDYHAMRDGFPDLMIARDGQIKFLEIKGEGDSVRRNQLTRLRQLKVAGLEADILRVAYRYDPQHIYVVVDIETTGGGTGYDRITEIGAVKVQGSEIIDEFHTLIYPQRQIPAYITKLTGISNEMVIGAPLFSEIAAKFKAFLKGSIFVAHNVNFDYGFIASEYERLEEGFKYPKFCTVANMRRHYPGHSSYSLGNLCEIYNVDLEDHHRALCDARAAAHLLNLINTRRSETSSRRRA